MDQSIPKNFNSVAIQIVATSNKRRGLDPLGLSKHELLFTAYDETRIPPVSRIFFSRFQRKELSPIIEFVKKR